MRYKAQTSIWKNTYFRYLYKYISGKNLLISRLRIKKKVPVKSIVRKPLCTRKSSVISFATDSLVRCQVCNSK